MIYEINDGEEPKKISFDEIDPDKLTVAMVSISKIEQFREKFDFSDTTISECNSEAEHFRSSISIYDDYSFGILNIIDVNNILGPRDKIGYYIMKNFFLIIDIRDVDGSTAKIFENAIKRYKNNATLEKIIYAFFDRLLNEDNTSLEKLDFYIDTMEDQLDKITDNKAFNKKLLKMKRRLLILRNYYEQLIDIGEELQENSNDIFTEEELRYFKFFTDKSERLSSNTQMIREHLLQLREAYQASLDYNLNSIMKVFTVVTTIFLPLTLIVGWYGMNFTNMPELTWEYGYLTVILISIIVVVACVAFFKRKKLF